MLSKTPCFTGSECTIFNFFCATSRDNLLCSPRTTHGKVIQFSMEISHSCYLNLLIRGASRRKMANIWYRLFTSLRFHHSPSLKSRNMINMIFLLISIQVLQYNTGISPDGKDNKKTIDLASKKYLSVELYQNIYA